MAKWFIARAGKDHGPFGEAQLKQFANSGKLKPDDIVRCEDEPAGRMAKEIRELWSAAPEVVNCDEQGPAAKNQTQANSPDLATQPEGRSFAERAMQSAARFTVFAKKQAELKSLVYLEIPAAHYKIGLIALTNNLKRGDFSQIYIDIEQIDIRIADLLEARPECPEKTLANRAKSLGATAVNRTRIEALRVNRKKLVTALGGQIALNARSDVNAILQDDIKHVQELYASQSQVKQELSELKAKHHHSDNTESTFGTKSGKNSWLMSTPLHPMALITSIVLCFPIGLYLLWSNAALPVRRKLKWTGAFLAILSVLFIFRGTTGDETNLDVADQAVGGEVGKSESMMHIPTDPLRPETLTHDFYPHSKGLKQDRLVRSAIGTLDLQSRREYYHDGNGTITCRTIKWFLTKKPYTTLPLPDPEYTQYRRNGRFIEISSLDASNETMWSKIIKIGAAVGDEWSDSHPGFTDHYKLLSFKEKDIHESLFHSGRAWVAVIQKTTTFEGDGSMQHLKIYELGHGIGEIESMNYEVISGERRPVSSSVLVPMLR